MKKSGIVLIVFLFSVSFVLGATLVAECSDGEDNDGDGLRDALIESYPICEGLYFQYNRNMRNNGNEFDLTLDQIVPGNKFQDFNFRNQKFKLYVDLLLLSTLSETSGYGAPGFSGDPDSYIHRNLVTRASYDIEGIPESTFYAEDINATDLWFAGNFLDLSSQPAGNVWIFKDLRRDKYRHNLVHSSRVTRAAAVTSAPDLVSGFPWAYDGYYNTYGNGGFIYVDDAGELHFYYKVTHNYAPRPVFSVGIINETCVPPNCSNGIDDDGDGFCDTTGSTCTDGSTPGDSGCASPRDTSESEHDPGCVDPSDDDEYNFIPTNCSDGIDNDGDGFCDTDGSTCTDGSTLGDPDCDSLSDNSEVGCGGSTLFRLYQNQNSHVELASESNYGIEVCGVTNVCDGSNDFLWLFANTDSHASALPTPGYTTKICSDSCYVQQNACSAGDTLVASMYQSQNSHVSLGDDSNYNFKICCGATGGGLGDHYFARPGGEILGDGDTVGFESDVLLIAPTGPIYNVFLNSNTSNIRQVTSGGGTFLNPSIWKADLLGNGVNFTSSAGVSKDTINVALLPDDPISVSINAYCGQEINRTAPYLFEGSITDSDNVVSGNITVGDSVYPVSNANSEDFAFSHTFSTTGTIPVKISLKNFREVYEDEINLIIYDSGIATKEYFVASCIDSPQRGVPLSSTKVDFDASSTKAVVYQSGNVVDRFVKDDLFFEWEFRYGDGHVSYCSGHGSNFCDDAKNNPFGYNMYSFSKIFPTAGNNAVRLTVTIPPALIA